jgi:hypothetical protein
LCYPAIDGPQMISYLLASGSYQILMAYGFYQSLMAYKAIPACFNLNNAGIEG